jgi:hypothetical protein
MADPKNHARLYYEKFRFTDRLFRASYPEHTHDSFARALENVILRPGRDKSPPDRKRELYEKLRDEQLAHIEKETLAHKHRIELTNVTKEAHARLIQYGYTATSHNPASRVVVYEFIVAQEQQEQGGSALDMCFDIWYQSFFVPFVWSCYCLKLSPMRVTGATAK